jgi:hypothetical protein
VRSHEASGPARQIVPDDSFQMEATVRDAFFDCSQRAQQRNRQRKATSMRGLVTTNGQNITFSAAARRNVSEDILQMIRCFVVGKAAGKCSNDEADHLAKVTVETGAHAGSEIRWTAPCTA